MRIVEAVGALAVLAGIALTLVVLAAVVHATSRTASRVSGGVRRLSQSARQPDQIAAAAAQRLARMTDPAEVSDLRLRVTLRRRVAAAAHAVRTAEQAGAHVGDLPRVSDRLVRHAETVEQRLALVPPGGWGERPSPARLSAREDAQALIAMAAQAHEAAADALGGLSVPLSRTLAAEVSDATAGVRAAAAWLRERGADRPRPGAG